mgnify:CR=1 FL=1|tara:strand:+ start:5152 stop:5355 length:204 start_codon:yes stop_codon:yes gene_type:complete
MGDTLINVDAPVTVKLPEGRSFSFIDSIRDLVDDTVSKIMSYDTVALTAVFMSLMLIIAFVALWRGI